MPVWNITFPKDSSLVLLASWQVLQASSGARHLVGVLPESGEGRVTSAVRDFDTVRLVATTKSGRRYALEGEPGLSADAQYVWQKFARLSSITAWEDISQAIWGEHVAASKSGAAT